MSNQPWPDNLIEARRFLLRSHPGYAMPVFGSSTVFRDDIPTAATDGKSIFLNPKFIHRMPFPHLAFVLAHEGTHILCEHPDMMARGKWPNNAPLNSCKFNGASDYWINTNHKQEGFQFPTNIQPLYDRKYDGLTIHQIYDRLPDQNGGSGQGPGGSGQGGLSCGDDVIPHKLTPEEKTENRIKITQAYEAARSMGNVPAWMEQIVGEIRDPKLDYRAYINAWIRSNTDRQILSYRQLHRRYLPDFYAPVLTGECFGNLAVGLDTSGSCWDYAKTFLSEFNGILGQLSPVNTTLVPFDTVTKDPQDFPAGETISAGYTLKGRGGTDFRCVFDYLSTKPIDALIMLTDLQGTFPDFQPPYPVLWVSTYPDTTAPFGTVIHADFKED